MLDMRGVFLDAGSLTKADIDMTPLGRGPIHWAYYDYTDKSAVTERIAKTDIVITNKVMLDESALAAASRFFNSSS